MKQQTGLYLFIYFFDAREKAETKSFVPPKHLKTMRNFFKEFTFQNRKFTSKFEMENLLKPRNQWLRTYLLELKHSKYIVNLKISGSMRPATFLAVGDRPHRKVKSLTSLQFNDNT